MSDLKARLDEMVSEHPAIKYAMYRPSSRDRQQALESVALSLLSKLDQREAQVAALHEALSSTARDLHTLVQPLQYSPQERRALFYKAELALSSTAAAAKDFEDRIRKEEREKLEIYGEIVAPGTVDGWYAGLTQRPENAPQVPAGTKLYYFKASAEVEG